MQLRLNLQWKVLLLVAGTITAILLASSYLHGLIRQSLSEETRYNNAIRQVTTVAKRTQTRNYFNSPADLLQEIEFLANARPEFLQLDVYQNVPDGEKLVATTALSAARLPYLNEQSKDNELGEMERPFPDVTTMEVERDGQRRWLITVKMDQSGGEGYVTALVQKNSPTNFVSASISTERCARRRVDCIDCVIIPSVCDLLSSSGTGHCVSHGPSRHWRFISACHGAAR